jgi:hypothetical protein
MAGGQIPEAQQVGKALKGGTVRLDIRTKYQDPAA